MTVEAAWMLLVSKIAGIGLVITFTLFLAVLLISILEFRFKRLIKFLKVLYVHRFGNKHRERKAKRKEQNK